MILAKLHRKVWY